MFASSPKLRMKLSAPGSILCGVDYKFQFTLSPPTTTPPPHPCTSLHTPKSSSGTVGSDYGKAFCHILTTTELGVSLK